MRTAHSLLGECVCVCGVRKRNVYIEKWLKMFTTFEYRIGYFKQNMKPVCCMFLCCSSAVCYIKIVVAGVFFSVCLNERRFDLTRIIINIFLINLIETPGKGTRHFYYTFICRNKFDQVTI